jgi:predicted RNase H-like HicB family nuclease
VRLHIAKASRDGRFWLVHLPEIDRWTQARTLKEIPEMATELIELITEESANTFELSVVMEMPVIVSEHAASLRAAAADAQASYQEDRPAARELKGRDVSLRGIGELLGISHQRAGQLVS